MAEIATIQTLREQRVAIVGRMRELNEGAEKENRDLTQEERNQFGEMEKDALALQNRIQRAETINAMAGISNGRSADERGPDPVDPPSTSKGKNASEEYRTAFGNWLRNGPANLSPTEQRAISTVDAEGGYLLAPLKLVDELIVALNERVYIRSWATKYSTTGAKSLGQPTIATDVEDATWTAEVSAVDEDTALAFGRRDLEPSQLTKLVKISLKMLRNVPNVENIVRDRLAYKFGVTLEKAYLTGNGTGQPLGVFVASADGIPAGRDTVAAGAAAIVMDDLVKVKFGLSENYWPRARWMLHSNVALAVALIKDTTGNYIWRENVRVGEPNTLLGFPAHMSAYAPSSIATGLYTAILGDFGYYHIADDQTLEIQRLVELYAATNQVGVIGRWWSDGMPALGEAFRRLKQA